MIVLTFLGRWTSQLIDYQPGKMKGLSLRFLSLEDDKTYDDKLWHVQLPS
jgi:hypothetical protein